MCATNIYMSLKPGKGHCLFVTPCEQNGGYTISAREAAAAGSTSDSITDTASVLMTLRDL